MPDEDEIPAKPPQQQKKVLPMLDVHPVHKTIHGWRDFLLHLLTITIGLFIALSLEGLLEWRQHRHLVHEAEASLHAEIRSNAAGLSDAVADIKKQREKLADDVKILKQLIKTGELPKNSNLEINFKIRRFENLSWKTAQSTNALSYMSYEAAKQYAEIYDTQEQLEVAEHEAARDAIISLAPFLNIGDVEEPSRADAPAMKEHIEILQAQLILLDSLVAKLDNEYKKFLAPQH
jgi:hypothetical protein